MRIFKAGLSVAALIVLAGCAAGHQDERWPQVPPASAARPPVYVPPMPQPPAQPVPSAETPPSAQQSPIARSNDQCGAAALQYLVGRPRTEIPVPLQPSTRRVVCSSCVITQDYRADRQTIVFDSDTGLIKSVGCG
jgi:hypothetical protein